MIYPESALILAPLSGFTDLAYRRAARRGGCRFAFTEMVDAASLAYASGNGMKLLLRGEEEDFLATQLVGSDPELLKRACDKLNEYDFSLLDFNLGCPVPKVVKKHAGAALGRDIDNALRCFKAIAQNSKYILTAKMRIVHETDVTPTLDLCAGLVGLGAKALTIHGRTMEHFYTGEVNFDFIRAVKETFPDVEVIANGGVNSLETYQEMREKSGCSRVMLATGAMGNPWLFGTLDNTMPEPPDIEQWRTMVHRHIADMVMLYGEMSAMKQARKIVHDYLKGRGFPSALRAEASALNCMDDLQRLLDKAEPAAVPQGSTRRIACPLP